MNEITMDPNACYLEIIDAMHQGELELARELAFALREWLDRTGFYPRQFAQPAIDAYLAGVLRRTAHLP
jgi:hypothetical protein